MKQGYEPYEEQVKVVEGERKKVSASLKTAAGSLFVKTDPSGANIFIDGRSVGVSPYEGRDLSSGTHRVRVAKEGYDNCENDVMVKAGRDVQVFATLREGKSPTKTKEQRVGGAGVGKNTKVYFGILQKGYEDGLNNMPTYRHFHKKDCKHLWSVSTEEVTAGEAIARGKSMCPDCFR